MEEHFMGIYCIISSHWPVFKQKEIKASQILNDGKDISFGTCIPNDILFIYSTRKKDAENWALTGVILILINNV